jgi:hypothetical protein
MGQTRKPQPQIASAPAFDPSEVALIERFRRLKDKQKSFLSRSIDILLSNESARPGMKAEHAMLAVKWRAKGSNPIKVIEQCAGIWENPTGQKFDIADPFSRQTVPIEDVDAPGDIFFS